jgi:hypothetical protein
MSATNGMWLKQLQNAWNKEILYLLLISSKKP